MGLAACVGGMAPVFAQSADPVLMAGEGVEVRQSDILSDAKRLPPEMHDSFLAKPENVAQMAQAIYVRRALAARARGTGMADEPATKAAVAMAADKILSDTYLADFDKKQVPDQALVEAQVKAAYAANKEQYKAPEQVHVAHILIANEDDASAKSQAEELLQQVKGGADFAKLASEKSSDPGSRAKGGDLGLVARGRMVPEFEEAAFALKKPGDVSPVVKSKFGYHIIKLIEHKPARIMSLEEVGPQLQAQYKKHAQQRARQDLQDKLLTASTTEKANIEALSAGFKAR